MNFSFGASRKGGGLVLKTCCGPERPFRQTTLAPSSGGRPRYLEEVLDAHWRDEGGGLRVSRTTSDSKVEKSLCGAILGVPQWPTNKTVLQIWRNLPVTFRS